MIDRLKGKENLIRLVLLLSACFGIYLITAWASYSPLDNAWSTASSITHETLNKTGALGAYLVDLLFAMFGKVAVFVPFGLAFTSIYVLILRLADDLNWAKIGLWLGSFFLFLVGLAGLSSVLFENSPYYLSGGFIGGMLASWLNSQMVLLLVAMLLTAVGFYFCSGQILLQLFNRLYHWIVEGKTEDKPSTLNTDEAVQTEENEEKVEAESESEETVDNPQYTDVSQFTRPHITGLKTVQEEEVAADVELTDVTKFKVENPSSLPSITVPEFDVSVPSVSTSFESPEETVIMPNVTEPVMPKVRLNPVVEVAAEPTVEPFEEAQSTPQFLQENLPLFEPKVATAEAQPEKKGVTYPKGYGDSLIHPLLQTKRKVEKPTTPLPTIDLLTTVKSEEQQITEQEIRDTSARIERELANFGVRATVEDVLVGPVVTRYEIKPAAGVKAAKITNLASDLARSLIFEAIRITDVVPGKPYMGIETPNRQRETVWLRDVLDSNEFRHTKATLPMALGKDISGKPIVVDMAKMPHLLVAGQTGGGKSVGVNTMILSLLFKLSPEQVRFIMIDPKVVELSIYNDIPHLLTPVVTDMKKAENALRWAVEEMERRYLLVSSLNVRNIEGFNAKIDQAAAMDLPIPNPLWRPGDTMDSLPPPLEKLSYIVLIVDEFADLMMSAGKQVEDHIMRIAQKARAVGIHLILATQRPSTDVITGVIKANIPSRIAFTVASQIDSRTILDKGGAESLLGRGDMLYSGAGSPEMIRVHGAFMTDEDVQRVADNWRARGKPEYIESIVVAPEGDENGESSERTSGELDPLFDEIAQFMIDGGATSISGVQRRFSLGFNRAARIIEQLEEQGIISAPDSRGKREVLAR
ncbi:DNA translocase FtsK 4TM domain-containing protein [Glaesserella parasuis]|uniref:DNA translocase FtsK n=1 Tax=Glaesserella parasuis TaxID=738 RepID=UPI00055828C1|nr:DNA translocase FtsK [Glaesserella parasuis]MCT8541338.1 DNA translocase FtsK 4TM domain-containing protein [Glaesserella parasuis]MCT8564506.1 DNA translocase FtsK 4TM domain-containing protein [Glaesserella parasuis]MCT8632985.1 DNA translocase FtsK 4TM domain-containing protein [Glaesserella parasuis]MCT8751036.1 DNA translocase FtsK 4TM domain-containing protein [Glaesserella parasuis]MCT8843127.1 DNA translocase FtsK 4TM domain-containing protein [Glaesserella parasuis]